MAYPFYPYQNQYQYPTFQTPQMPVSQTFQNQQNANQPYNPVSNQTGIIWISGESEAAMFPIAPNSAVALWEKSGKTIYLKQADATGKPTITVYDLVKRDSAETSDSSAQSFASKEDLGKVVDVMKDYSDLLDSLKTDVETIKGDMYGIAGKKKTVKKAVEASDDE